MQTTRTPVHAAVALIVLILVGLAAAAPELSPTVVHSQYAAAQNRMFFFDYDGTLTPIVKKPSQAVPSRRALSALKRLAANPRNGVWVISGRDPQFLDKHLGGIPGVGFSAEHGSLIKQPGATKWDNLAEQLGIDMGWLETCQALLEEDVAKYRGSELERKENSMTWHYRNAPGADVEAVYRGIDQKIIREYKGVEVIRGKMNLEVRPSFTNKGEIVKMLMGKHPAQFAFTVGDDVSDEDMFKALDGLPQAAGSHYVSVAVGPATKKTEAKFSLPGPREVIEMVDGLSRVK